MIDIGDQMTLVGDKMFKYILQFSLRFTEWSYEIISFYLTRTEMSIRRLFGVIYVDYVYEYKTLWNRRRFLWTSVYSTYGYEGTLNRRRIDVDKEMGFC